MRDREIIIGLLQLLVIMLLAAAVVDLRMEVLELERYQQHNSAATEVLRKELADTRTDLDHRVRVLDGQVQYFISGGWK